MFIYFINQSYSHSVSLSDGLCPSLAVRLVVEGSLFGLQDACGGPLQSWGCPSPDGVSWQTGSDEVRSPAKIVERLLTESIQHLTHEIHILADLLFYLLLSQEAHRRLFFEKARLLFFYIPVEHHYTLSSSYLTWCLCQNLRERERESCLMWLSDELCTDCPPHCRAQAIWGVLL